MKDLGSEAYESYVAMCERLRQKPLERWEYEKKTEHVGGQLVNADVVLMNNNQSKDREGRCPTSVKRSKRQ